MVKRDNTENNISLIIQDYMYKYVCICTYAFNIKVIIKQTLTKLKEKYQYDKRLQYFTYNSYQRNSK